jgi:hypothetical protein
VPPSDPPPLDGVLRLFPWRSARVISAKQIKDAPPTAIANAASEPVIVSSRSDDQLCNAIRHWDRHDLSSNVATAFIDHSSEIWNFCREKTALSAVLLHQKGDAMRKTLVALTAIATLAISAAAPAHAQRGLGAAVAGGIIGGAIVGGAIAASPYGYGYGPGYGYGYGPGYYGPGYGYYGGPAYVAADPYGCYWQRQRFWDGYGWRFRRVRVCG